MSPRVSDVLAKARELNADEQRELAVSLLSSVVAPDIEQSWTEEALKRVADVDAGSVVTISDRDAWKIISSDD